MNKIWIWMLAVGLYVFNWFIPALIIFQRHSVEVSTHRGGGFWYAIMVVFLVIFGKAMLSKKNTMKPSKIRLIFRLGTVTTLLYVVQYTLQYISLNFSALDLTVGLIMLSVLAGGLCEFIALSIDKAYVREIEVF